MVAAERDEGAGARSNRTLCLATDFSSGDQRPKSLAVHETSWWVAGLYAIHWTESL